MFEQKVVAVILTLQLAWGGSCQLEVFQLWAD